MHMTCKQCKHEWCWICGWDWKDNNYHKGTTIRFWHCGSIYNPPDTCKRKCNQYMYLMTLIVFMPFILIGVFGWKAIDKMRPDKLVPDTYYMGTCKKFILHFLLIPWYLILSFFIGLIFVIVGVPCMLVTLLPAWFYNVRRFRRMQLYWKGKLTPKKKPAPIPPAPTLILRPPTIPLYAPPPRISPRAPIINITDERVSEPP